MSLLSPALDEVGVWARMRYRIFLLCKTLAPYDVTSARDSACIRDIVALFLYSGRKQRPVVHLYLCK